MAFMKKQKEKHRSPEAPRKRAELFQVSLKAFVRKGNAILVIRDAAHFTGLWDLPGGRIDEDERSVPIDKILRRELEEECGKNFRVHIGQPVVCWRRYDHPNGPIFFVGFDCVYKSGALGLSEEHNTKTQHGSPYATSQSINLSKDTKTRFANIFTASRKARTDDNAAVAK